MVNMVIWLDGSKVAISTSKTKHVQDRQKNFKLKTWRHYSINIAARPSNNCLIHESLPKWLLANVYIILDWFKKWEMGYHMK